MNEKIIFDLIDKFNASSLSELEFSGEGVHITLRRDSGLPETPPPRQYEQSEQKSQAAGHSVTVAAGKSKPVTPPSSASVADDKGEIENIKSPIVGVFYASSEQNAQPFVKAGSTVKAGDILCVLEAMKMMNKLVAEFDCEIISVKVSNGDMVEYGQTLFEVRRL
ncbi:MAG: acetyl-CoA carboxylase biotin carboxyl carrier protein [Spirochaetaceae bacterium]|nr:acetyl-CoA carboxylase biotin carboxyl carrier protein [Spirochaetaceae bacterium]